MPAWELVGATGWGTWRALHDHGAGRSLLPRGGHEAGDLRAQKARRRCASMIPLVGSSCRWVGSAPSSRKAKTRFGDVGFWLHADRDVEELEGAPLQRG